MMKTKSFNRFSGIFFVLSVFLLSIPMISQADILADWQACDSDSDCVVVPSCGGWTTVHKDFKEKAKQDYAAVLAQTACMAGFQAPVPGAVCVRNLCQLYNRTFGTQQSSVFADYLCQNDSDCVAFKRPGSEGMITSCRHKDGPQWHVEYGTKEWTCLCDTQSGACRLVSSRLVPADVNDPIEKLVAKLNSDIPGMWVNGTSPIIKLPKDAQPAEVLAAAVKWTGFDKGNIKTYRIREVRDVELDTAPGWVNCSAVLLESDLGTKILLFRYEGKSTGWWTRFYDLKVINE